MKLIGKAEEIGTQIIKAFKDGTVPQALAQSYFVNPVFPSTGYSASNRLLIALTGMLRGQNYTGAGGFKYWSGQGRQVRRGEKAIYILAPLTGKRKEEDENTGEVKTLPYIYGFKSIAVFAYEQTDGEPIAELEDRESFIKNLPFIEVAEQWGIQVTIDANCIGNGYYAPGLGRIGLSVKNLSTWAHELCHAADEKIQGQLQPGQQAEQEIVAELGGAVLLSITGESYAADLGGCLEYIEFYADGDTGKTIKLATKLLDRTCKAVNLIVETASNLCPV